MVRNAHLKMSDALRRERRWREAAVQLMAVIFYDVQGATNHATGLGGSAHLALQYPEFNRESSDILPTLAMKLQGYLEECGAKDEASARAIFDELAKGLKRPDMPLMLHTAWARIWEAIDPKTD